MSKRAIIGIVLASYFVIVGAKELFWPTTPVVESREVIAATRPDVPPPAEPSEPEGPTDQDRRDTSEIKFRLAAEDLPGVASSRVDELGKLTVEVVQEWHFLPKQIRLQGAQDIGKVWQRCDHSRRGWFSLVDVNGNEVGGRGITGVWVAE